MDQAEYRARLAEIQVIRGQSVEETWPEGFGTMLTKVEVQRLVDGAALVHGYLILTPQYLLFLDHWWQDDYGTVTLGDVVWGVRLEDLDRVGAADKFFTGPVLKVGEQEPWGTQFYIVPGQGVNVFDLRNMVVGRVAAVKETMSPEADNVAEEVPGAMELDGVLASVVAAYQGTRVIPFREFYAAASDLHDVTKAVVRRRLAQLLARGAVAGQLTTKGFKRVIVGVIQCQVCDRTEVDPQVYWQCPQCYRKVCAGCRSKQTTCPGHPETRTKLVKMPRRCPQCHAVIGELQAVSDYLCQQCGSPLPPP